MLVGLLSAKGSPGVTTASLALAAVWPRPVVMMDADPFGGDVRAGLGRGGWPTDAGVAELVVDLRSSTMAHALARLAHRPNDHAPAVLAGIASIAQAKGVPWSSLAPELAAFGGADCIADCGRLVPDVLDDLLQSCDAVVLFSGSTLREARAAVRAVPVVQARAELAGIVVSRPGRPYGAAEIADSCSLELLGVLPDDPRTASVWSDGDPPTRSLLRAAYMRAADRIACSLADFPIRRRTA
jgi:hypothetical protein